jgi:hypothetical protein
MEPGSRASSSVERTSLKLANLLGTVMALLTLTVPLFAIAYFSPTVQAGWQSSGQLLPSVKR